MDPISRIEIAFHIELKHVSGAEYCGPCPICGGTDRWHFWVDRLNWWCRPGPGHCGRKGFLDELFDDVKAPTQQDRLEWRMARIEEQQREMERRLSALERMAQSTDHLNYHYNITTDAVVYFNEEGITNASIDKYMLGYCPRCPTDRQGRPSYTIPVINDGTLLNIRHRLVGADSDKYRPHMAGLGVQLFNADYLDEPGESILIVEGEKKSIVVAQLGIPNVGIVGKRSFMKDWLTEFGRFQTVYIALDPDATESAYRLGALFGERARVARMPVKIDEAVFRYGATRGDIEAFLANARPVRVKH